MSNSHTSLFTKEQCEWFACASSKSLAKNERFARKIHIFSMFLTVFPLFYAQEQIPPVAFCSFALFLRVTWAIRSRCSLQKSNHELFAQVAHDKRVTVNDSLRLLMTKEQGKRFALFREQIILSLFCKKKKANCSKKHMSEFPTLQNWHFFMFSQMVKTQLSLSQNNFLVIGTHLTVA